jgi:hypothetical protein
MKYYQGVIMQTADGDVHLHRDTILQENHVGVRIDMIGEKVELLVSNYQESNVRTKQGF